MVLLHTLLLVIALVSIRKQSQRVHISTGTKAESRLRGGGRGIVAVHAPVHKVAPDTTNSNTARPPLCVSYEKAVDLSFTSRRASPSGRRTCNGSPSFSLATTAYLHL